MLVEHGSRVLGNHLVGGFYEFAAVLDLALGRGDSVARRFGSARGVARVEIRKIRIYRVVYVVDGDRVVGVDHLEVLAFAARVDGFDRVLDGRAGGRPGRVSYVQLVEPLREAVRVDAAAVRAAHGVRAAVGLGAQPVQDVLEGSVVHLVLVKQLLFADGLRLRL